MQSSIWYNRYRLSLAAYPRVWDGQSTRFLALLLMRFAMRSPLLVSRWALTPPFHPYPRKWGRFAFCCTVCSLTAPGRYPASCPVELGLSSRMHARKRLLEEPSVLTQKSESESKSIPSVSNPLESPPMISAVSSFSSAARCFSSRSA